MDDFGLAVEAHRKRLMASAMKLCRDTDQAEDLVQETMMRAIRNQHLFEPGSNLAGWLYTILRNQFFSERRKDGRIVADADDLLSKMVPAREDHAAAYEAKEALSFLVLIPLHMRRALLLTANGMSIEEIARHEGVADGTIKSRVHRGRSMLADLIGDRSLLQAAGQEL